MTWCQSIIYVLSCAIVALIALVIYLVRANQRNYRLAMKYMILAQDKSNVFCVCCNNGVKVLGPEDFDDCDVIPNEEYSFHNGHVYKRY